MATLFKAVLCDMDGTFVNTEDISHKGYELACKQFGKVFTEQLHRDIMGTKSDYWSKYLVEQLALSIEPNEFKKLCSDMERDLIASEIRIMDGFIDLLNVVKSLKMKFVLVTSSRRASVERNLNLLGMENPFDDWVTAEAVKHGKPDPEPFLVGARKAGVSPKDCISIEDSYFGVKSAVSAGTTVFAVPGKYSRGADFSIATKVFKNLRECALVIEEGM